ncbi:cobalamin synthase [Acetivibrio straminisolvens JCM 21531]|uniref:Cobalamin synthase n=1 Tax=Acetivibrio straminisolvens JCM 21531 TaxID=1294263 RepID=W4V5H8_9FIRM|nr:cobalamin synthase [Acetivibrio straminisolvens JCM 21531]
MKYLKRLILMIGFLTRIPIPFEFDATEEDYGKGWFLLRLLAW